MFLDRKSFSQTGQELADKLLVALHNSTVAVPLLSDVAFAAVSSPRASVRPPSIFIFLRGFQFGIYSDSGTLHCGGGGMGPVASPLARPASFAPSVAIPHIARVRWTGGAAGAGWLPRPAPPLVCSALAFAAR